MGKKIRIRNEIICHTLCQDKKDKEKIIIIGKINSADESPNHIALNAFPLLILKYLDIVVVEVCDIRP